MKHNTPQWKITTLMPLMILLLFALCLLTVLLTGAGIYRQTVSQGQALSASRTAIRYLTTRIRQADAAEQFSPEQFGGSDALVFYEEIDSELYKTTVYCHDGYLRELFCSATGVFSPADGERILPMERLSLKQDGNSLQVQILLPEGTVQNLTLYLRSEREVLP